MLELVVAGTATVTVIVIVSMIIVAVLLLNTDINTNRSCNWKKQHLNEYFACWWNHAWVHGGDASHLQQKQQEPVVLVVKS